MKTKALISGVAACWLLASCAPSVQHYGDQSPEFRPEQFFSGQLTAVGIVQDFTGEVTRRFEADIVAQWQGNQGILDEKFIFNDGEEQWRCWRLEQHADALVGTAGDVVGEATGRVSGNTLNWQYVLRVARENGDTVDVRLDDWLYLVNKDYLINRTSMHKFGLPVGEITLAIHRVNDQPQRANRKECRLAI